MAEDPELEDLDQLVRSNGWGRFVQMVEKQWGASSEWFLSELDKAISTDNAHGHEHFRQVRASQREIARVMKMVPDRLKALKEQPAAAYHPSRRGTL